MEDTEQRPFNLSLSPTFKSPLCLHSPILHTSQIPQPATPISMITGDNKVNGVQENSDFPTRFDSNESNKQSNAALKVQKVYRSYRTRRRLADSAVVAEEFWWQAIDYARLNYSTISFFNFQKPEAVSSRWNRITLFASKVGKGLSKDDKAQKLAFQHWIEAIDPRHRYGHCLQVYYTAWCKEESGQPFFYWLDIGDGKELDLKECPRAKLRQQCIKYLGPNERESFEYIASEGMIRHKQTGLPLDTNKGSKKVKWIFVLSTSKKMYASEKKKGVFHHSSFLAGGATLAAGRLEADDGILKSVSPYSGHYRPGDESLDSFLSFLKENGVALDDVRICKANEDYNYHEDGQWGAGEILANPESSDCCIEGSSQFSEVVNEGEAEAITKSDNYQRSLSGGLQSPRAEIPKNTILKRINSKKTTSSYQLGHQVSLKWSSGAGPRIGCVADYPKEVRAQALGFLNLSPT